MGSKELDYMTSGPVPVPGRGNNAAYAAGIFEYETKSGKAFGHSGIWFGYKTMVIFYPSLCVGATMQVNSQIDGNGNDLRQYRLNGRQFSMVDMLTELVRSELRSGERPSCFDLATDSGSRRQATSAIERRSIVREGVALLRHHNAI